MLKRKIAMWCLLLAFAGSTAMLQVGCRDRGPAEEAGREIDEGIEDAGDAMEDLGDDIEDGLDG